MIIFGDEFSAFVEIRCVWLGKDVVFTLAAACGELDVSVTLSRKTVHRTVF